MALGPPLMLMELIARAAVDESGVVEPALDLTLGVSNSGRAIAAVQR